MHGRVSIQYFLASSVQDAAERSPSDSSGNFNPTFVEGDVRGWGLRRTIGVAASYLWSTEATLAGLNLCEPRRRPDMDMGVSHLHTAVNP